MTSKPAEDEQNATQRASIAELFRFATSYDILLMIIGTIGGVVNGASVPVFNVLFGRILDELNEDPDGFTDAINRLCIIMVIVAGINFFASACEVGCWGFSGERQTQQFRERYVNSILKQDVGWFDTCGAGELTTKVADLTGNVQDGIGRKMGSLIEFGSQFLLSYAAALYINWELTLVLLGTLPFIAAMGFYLIRAVEGVTSQAMEQYANAGSVATEALSAVRTVSSLNAQPHFIHRYRSFILEAMHVGIGKGLKLGIGNGGLFGVIFLTYGLGFWYGARQVADALDDGDSSPTGGDIIAVFFSVIIGSMALGQLAPPVTAFTKARVAVAGLMEVINRKPLIDGLSNEGTIPTDSTSTVTTGAPHNSSGSDANTASKIPTASAAAASAIELRDVDFAYPARPDTLVCKQYSFSIAAGESVALVGASGSGKSTIVQLLLRFYDPQAGCIMLDGRDIRSLNVRWLRSQIGYVGQEPVLFAGTVADNIAYGLTPDISHTDTLTTRSSAASAVAAGKTKAQAQADSDMRKKLLRSPSGRTDVMARVIAAAKLANAHDFISGFPNGYDTDVGSNGGSMSGGQKQRIAIARALIKKPAVLLLDEATSALDAASERLVQQSIDDLQQRKAQTTIVIAHRLSTIRSADKICVIDSGRIVESGTHDELLQLNSGQGIYAAMWAKQDGSGDK